MLGSFACILLYAVFSSKLSLKNTITVSNGLGPDQERCFVGPDLGHIIKQDKELQC